MRGRLVYVTVLGLVAFFPWAALAQGAEGDPVRGQQIFRQLGCLECHTVRGEGGGGETKAPELATILGETVELDDGRRVEITVREGDRVVLRLISGDVRHGFALPAFGINDGVIRPGDVTVMEFVADKVGSFKFFCTIRYGTMHETMEAVLTVALARADVSRGDP